MNPVETRNGDENGALVDAKDLEQWIQRTFPRDEIVYAFGYGSGVFSQQQKQQQQQQEVGDGNSASTLPPSSSSQSDAKLIDLILVVKDAYSFHHQNYLANPHHYYGTTMLQPLHVVPNWAAWLTAQLQRFPWEGRYFQNPRVYFNLTDTVKYGVVQVQDLIVDLSEWKYLYIAGRLHKPILPLFLQHDEPIQNVEQNSILQAQRDVNLPAALSLALLMLSNSNTNNSNRATFSERDIYQTIAGLSYHGDPRMQLGAEDPQKISRLVQSTGQLQRFRSLYQSSLDKLIQEGIFVDQTIRHQELGNEQEDPNNGNCYWTWDPFSSHTLELLWSKLPKNLWPATNNNKNTPLRIPPSQRPVLLSSLSRQIATRVAASARLQSIKGVVTVGPHKAWNYLIRKWKKGFHK